MDSPVTVRFEQVEQFGQGLPGRGRAGIDFPPDGVLAVRGFSQRELNARGYAETTNRHRASQDRFR